MGLSIEYPLGSNDTPKAEVAWCNAQGWQHIIDWRWFWNHPSKHRSIQLHFENPAHAHWFILRWGGTITGTI